MITGQDTWIIEVSIHAPVKGATAPLVTLNGTRRVSIHAPVKGATYTKQHQLVFSFGFNPRSREGSDVRFYF